MVSEKNGYQLSAEEKGRRDSRAEQAGEKAGVYAGASSVSPGIMQKEKLLPAQVIEEHGAQQLAKSNTGDDNGHSLFQTYAP